MTRVRDIQSRLPRRLSPQLIVVLIVSIAIISVVVGCSTETRHRVKTIVFTGVPPLHGEQPTQQPEQDGAAQSAAAEQLARQQEYRDALVSPYWQHGPFAAGECERCHSLGQSASFLGSREAASDAPSPVASLSAPSRLLMPLEKLCVSCHSQHGTAFALIRDLQQHAPSASGACTGCHSPHQSLRRYMLLRADNRELCGSCHEPATLTSIHFDNLAQDCISCHNAHVGIKSDLLRSDAQELRLLYGPDIDD